MVRSGWLIESAITGPEGLHYLCIRKIGNWDLEWLPGPDRALRFARKEDADAMIELAREWCPDLFPRVMPMPQSVEHMWPLESWAEGTTYVRAT